MEAACRRYDVPLAAAALQFSMRSEVIDSTVVGVSSPQRISPDSGAGRRGDPR